MRSSSVPRRSRAAAARSRSAAPASARRGRGATAPAGPVGGLVGEAEHRHLVAAGERRRGPGDHPPRRTWTYRALGAEPAESRSLPRPSSGRSPRRPEPLDPPQRRRRRRTGKAAADPAQVNRRPRADRGRGRRRTTAAPSSAHAAAAARCGRSDGRRARATRCRRASPAPPTTEPGSGAELQQHARGARISAAGICRRRIHGRKPSATASYRAGSALVPTTSIYSLQREPIRAALDDQRRARAALQARHGRLEPRQRDRPAVERDQHVALLAARRWPGRADRRP